jgi:hypothetical protein
MGTFRAALVPQLLIDAERQQPQRWFVPTRPPIALASLSNVNRSQDAPVSGCNPGMLNGDHEAVSPGSNHDDADTDHQSARGAECDVGSVTRRELLLRS